MYYYLRKFCFPRKLSREATLGRSAGFPTCCVADFQIGWARDSGRPAGLEICDTADSEVCATSVAAAPRGVHPWLN
jgi:hypothetical protein